ncbi:hypothetical protein BCY89_12785 [Sphingobacterium siyangense]|uniref:TonB C-terminal domain-containing protein n=1 Tax=Sphingobacterium siyangense TaxID=459529 RepID=A0A420FJK4_9SPHI|nr:energy transducer TonB [Sphingobacterium siyangense]RKF33108.1 hypothetical protein BCY89_12785 [Sphingobacterium siyangense]
MKTFVFLLFTLCFYRAFAQEIKIKTDGQIIHIGTSKDTIIRFFDVEGDFLATKDKSYYYRQVYPVANEPKRLYRVQAFYTETNLPKFSGHSLNYDGKTLKYFGETVSYFPTGKVESVELYDELSYLIDTAYYYHPNGKLKALVYYEPNKTEAKSNFPHYLLYLDSLGNMLLRKGNGFFRFDYKNGQYIEGELVNDKREGIWTGWDQSKYEEFYKEDILINGKRYLPDGKINTYSAKTMEQEPKYHGNLMADIELLMRRVQFPLEFFEKYKKKTILVNFVVNKSGATEDYEIEGDYELSIKRMMIEAMQRLGKWTPAYLKGVPVRVRYTVPVRFNFELTER